MQLSYPVFILFFFFSHSSLLFFCIRIWWISAFCSCLFEYAKEATSKKNPCNWGIRSLKKKKKKSGIRVRVVIFLFLLLTLVVSSFGWFFHLSVCLFFACSFVSRVASTAFVYMSYVHVYVCHLRLL